MSAKFMVEFRKKVIVNTDPQRRCYWGCNFSEKVVWTDWADICAYSTREIAEDSMATFRSINKHSEYRIKED